MIAVIMLLELVKKSKEDKQALQKIIELFEPKLRKSLTLTRYEEREDLEQELRCKLITCIRKYDIESTPGFWEMKERIKKNNFV
ncbi:helix-turn-helix domain-containing protein [Pseudobacillus badius]|uniref:helix-turn-helix domain-containing protein n=1 Tax=Bacillus badius TaxID=1455 RepID=UPI0024A3C15A|nr:helix-turn-helix domain-containing protein [Bacillus badius]GLY12627.1 sigma-O factor regulatory protein RsoA [Bacillus badius]